MVEQTSLQAFTDICDTGVLGEMQLKVFNTIKKAGIPLSHYQIAQIMGVYPNNITGRVKELESVGLVRCVGYTYNDTGKRAKSWVAV